MDYKYLKVSGNDFIWGKNKVTPADLIEVRDRGYALIDVELGRYFDPEENGWKPITGDAL